MKTSDVSSVFIISKAQQYLTFFAISRIEIPVKYLIFSHSFEIIQNYSTVKTLKIKHNIFLLIFYDKIFYN